MKNIWTAILLSLVFRVVCAQEYKPFKFGLSLVGGASNDTYAPTAIFITLEPAYRISDDLAIGLRIEPGVFAGSKIDATTGIISFTINGQYYLSSDRFRPFVGGGLGSYAFESTGTRFGFYPRVGFDLEHFSMSLDYNFISAVSPSYPGQVTEAPKYLGVRIGVMFGGGKK